MFFLKIFFVSWRVTIFALVVVILVFCFTLNRRHITLDIGMLLNMAFFLSFVETAPFLNQGILVRFRVFVKH